jgi:hypothetical protein
MLVDLDYLTRAEKGSPHTASELDGIFSDIRSSVNALNSAVDSGIITYTITINDEGELVFNLSNGTQQGPFPITAAPLRPRGEWIPDGTLYAVGDLVSVTGSSFAAMTAHASATDFEADFTAGKWMTVADGTGGGGGGEADLTEVNARLDAIEAGAAIIGIWRPSWWTPGALANGKVVGITQIPIGYVLPTTQPLRFSLGTAPGSGKTVTLRLLKNGSHVAGASVSGSTKNAAITQSSAISFVAGDILSFDISSTDVGTAADINVSLGLVPA